MTDEKANNSPEEKEDPMDTEEGNEGALAAVEAKEISFLMDVPLFDVPQSHMCAAEKIFVRDCYSVYYDKVMEELEKTPLITVTGTPGIGKSLFYLYFFLTYRQDNPNERVLTASFTQERKLKECKLWKSVNEAAGAEDPLFKEYDKIPNEACALYLYDGGPEMEPNGSTRMVAFSGRNAIWFSITSKYEMHVAVYMPNWGPMELKLAADALDLELGEQELAKRISLFGGTARYTLTNNAAFSRIGVKALGTALSKIETIRNVQQCFEGTLDLDQVVHPLMHYSVDVNDWMEAKLKPSSKIVDSMIHDRLNKQLDTECLLLTKWLDGPGKASPFAAWLFENFAHEGYF